MKTIIAALVLLTVAVTVGAQDMTCMKCTSTKTGYKCVRDPDCWSSGECLMAIANQDKDGCPTACSPNGPICAKEKYAKETRVVEKRGGTTCGLFGCKQDECICTVVDYGGWKSPTKEEYFQRSQKRGRR